LHGEVTDFSEILTVNISRCGDSVEPYWPQDHSVQTITSLWRCGQQRPRSVTMMLPCRNIMRFKSMQRIESLRTAIPISRIFLSYSTE